MEQYCLKGQGDIMHISGIDTALERKGIPVYADEEHTLVTRRAFAEVCRMLKDKGIEAERACLDYEREVSKRQRLVAMFSVLCVALVAVIVISRIVPVL